MAKNTAPSSAEHQQHTEVTQETPKVTGAEVSASTAPEKPKSAGQPALSKPPAIDYREEYAEFLETQHFFNDTATFSSAAPSEHVETVEKQKEHENQRLVHFAFKEEPESEPFLPISDSPADEAPSSGEGDVQSNPEESDAPVDFFSGPQMFEIPQEEEPLPVEELFSPKPDEASYDEASSYEVSQLIPPPPEHSIKDAQYTQNQREEASQFISTSHESLVTSHEVPVGHEPEMGDHDWKIGDIIDGRYEVKEIIGRGGMGLVYRVHHRDWNLDMAVKMPLTHLVANQALKSRFVREAQTWIDLGLHPNIVQCWYVREFGGIPRVFMDYLPGGSLKDWMQQGRIGPGDWARILDLSIQACDGLGYAHEHGIKAHRDVKPANFLLTESGELRVTDFGIAKRHDHEEGEEQNFAVSVEGQQHTITVTGADVGTPEYGAPEQWGEAKHADARADIYALGGVLFELCCGRRAFDDGQHREQPYAIIGRHLFSPIPDPRTFNPEIPSMLVDIIVQCLAKEPDDRPNSMQELREYQVEVYKKIVGTPYWKEVPQAAELRSSTLNNRAVSLLDIGNTKEAFATLNEALKLDVHHAESVYNKALLEWREERIADDEVVRRLKEAKKTNRRAGIYLGMIHLERGAAQEAEQALTEALEDPELSKESTAWKGLGDALMAQEKYTQALRAYQEALDLVPGDKDLEQHRLLAIQESRKKDDQIIFPYPHCLRTFVGASDRADHLMLSSDTHYAITVSSDGAKLWNLTTGKYHWSAEWSEEGRGVWTFRSYAGSRTCVAMTPDAQFALSGGSDDYNIWVWNLETGQCINRFRGHTGEVTGLAILPDGYHALSASLDTTLRLWEIRTGNCLRIFESYQEPITALTVTPDGQYALFGSAHFLRQLDLTTGRIVRTYRGHGDDVTTITVVPNRQVVVSGSRDKTLRLWTLTSGRLLKTLTGHTGAITALALTPDGKFAISASQDKQLRMWDLKEGSCTNILQGHTSHVTAVAISPDAQFAFSVGRGRTLRLWRLATGQCLRVFEEFTHWLEALILTPDGQCILLGNHEEMRLKHLPTQTYRQILTKQIPQASDETSSATGPSIALHNLPPGENFLTLIGRDEEKTFTVATPHGNIGISGGAQETLCVWDVRPEHRQRIWGMRGSRGIQVFKAHRNVLRSIATTPDGTFALTGGEDGRARIWELPAGTCLQILEGHRGVINAVALTPDAKFLLTGGVDSMIRLWERETGRCVKVLEGHDENVTAVAITPDGQFAVSGSSDTTLRLWDLRSGKCLRTFEEQEDMVVALTITADAQYALSVTNDRILHLWRLDARAPRQRAAFQVCRHLGHRELEVFRKRFQRFLTRAKDARSAGNIATAYTFLTLARSIPGYERDPDALAVNASLSGYLEKKALKGGHLLHAIMGHKHDITTVATTLDGRLILSGSKDKTLRVWGLSTGLHLRTFEGHTDHITCVAATPDRHLAITGSRDRTLRLWAIATGECLKVLTGHDEYITSVAVSSDGRFAVSGSRDSTLRLWALATEEHHEPFEGLQVPAEVAYLSAERAPEKSIRLFKGHTDGVEAVAILPDNQFAISGSRDRTLRLWHLPTGRCMRIFRGHYGEITDVALSQDGQFIVSAGRDRTLRVWRLATGMCLHILRGHNAYVSSVAMTSDGHFAVSGSWDGTVRLWNLDIGKCIRVFERHEGQVETIALTADGHWAVSGGRDAILRVWEFDWELSPQKTRNPSNP